MSISVIYLSKGVQKGVLGWVKKVKKPIFSRARRSPANSLLITFVIETVSFDDCLKTPNVWDPFLPIFDPKMVQKMGVYTPNGTVPGEAKKRGQNETPFGGS